jgi:AcrR family transcriptional regulator
MSARIDRAAAVRAALRRLVARNGFHGASMSAVAGEAGVAAGTAYVHYVSKDDLVLAAYLEVKRELGAAAVADLDQAAPAEARFLHMWHAVHRHLAADPDRARFLIQVNGSPYAHAAHERAMARDGDPMMAEAAKADLASRLAPLPPEVLYDLGFGPAVRLAAAGKRVSANVLDALAAACWRAITRPATSRTAAPRSERAPRPAHRSRTSRRASTARPKRPAR